MGYLNLIAESFSGVKTKVLLTGWANVNILSLPDSIEIASLEGLTLWYPEINQSKLPLAW